MEMNDKEYKQLKLSLEAVDSQAVAKPASEKLFPQDNVLCFSKKKQETFRDRVIKDLLKSRVVIE